MIFKVSVLLALGLAHGVPISFLQSDDSTSMHPGTPPKVHAHHDLLALYAIEVHDPHAKSNQVLMALEKAGVDVHEEARKDDHKKEKSAMGEKAADIKAKAEATLAACKECKKAEDDVVGAYKTVEDAHTAAEAAATTALTKEGAYNSAKDSWSASIDAFIAAFAPVKADAAKLDTGLQAQFDDIVGGLKAVLGDDNHVQKVTKAEAIGKLDAMIATSSSIGNSIETDLKPKLKIVKTKEQDVRAKKAAYNKAMSAYNAALAAVTAAGDGIQSKITIRNKKCKGADLKYAAFEGKKYAAVVPAPSPPPPAKKKVGIVSPKSLVGHTLYAYKSNHCYKIVVGQGGSVLQKNTGSNQNCKAATYAGKHFYVIGKAKYENDKVASYTGGTSCGRHGARRATVSFIADPKATKITASVSEPSTCRYVIKIYGRGDMF